MYDYEPEFSFYGLPSWISGKDSIQLDFKTNRWNLARLVNSFKLSGIMVVPVGSPEEGKQVIERLEKQYTNQEPTDLNNDKLLVLAKSRNSGAERADRVELIQNNQEDNGRRIGTRFQSE